MRGLRRAIIGVAVLVLVLVALDRIGDGVAERRAAASLAPTLGRSADVQVHGFPFLSQWATGRYDSVAIDDARLTVSGTSLRKVRVDLRDVRTEAYLTGGDVDSVHVGMVRVAGTVPFDSLPLPSGVTAKRAGTSGDRMRLSGTVSVLGHDVSVTAVAALSLRDGDARLEPKRVRILGPVPSAVATDLVRDHLRVRIHPAGIPRGVALTSLSVTDTGVRVKAAGTDVTLSIPS